MFTISKQVITSKFLIILLLILTLILPLNCKRVQNKIPKSNIEKIKLTDEFSKFLTPSLILLGDYEKNVAFSPILSDNNKLFYLDNKALYLVDLDKIEAYNGCQILEIYQTEKYKLVERDGENVCRFQEPNLLYKPYFIDKDNIIYVTYLVSNNTFLDEGFINCYNLKDRKVLWREKLNLGLALYSLDHQLSLFKTSKGEILLTSVKPSLLYLLDSKSGKTKWIYNPECDFGDIGNNITTHSLAELRKFGFNIINIFNEGIVAKLQYTDETRKPYIERYLFIDWNGKLVRELKEEPFLFFNGKYLCEAQKKDRDKEIIKITCKTIPEDREIWKFEYENYFDKSQLSYRGKFLKDENSLYLTAKGEKGYYLYKVDLVLGREIFKEIFNEEIIAIYPLQNEIFVLCKNESIKNTTNNDYKIMSISKNNSLSINWVLEVSANKKNSEEFFIEENINYISKVNSKLIVFLNDSFIVIDLSLKSAFISSFSHAVEEVNTEKPISKRALELLENSRFKQINTFENKEWIILMFHEKARASPLICILFLHKNI